MHAKDVVHKFLSSIGSPAEAGQYLRWFRSEEPERFALVMVHDAVVTGALQALGADLRFLRQLDLTPVLTCSKDTVRTELLEGLEGDVELVASTAEDASTRVSEHRIPVLLTPDQESLSLAVHRLRSSKVVYLVPRSGIQPNGEPVRSLIDLTTDYDELSAPRTLPIEQQRMLADIRQLFVQARHHLTVSVTSPFDLVRELFTVKGAGTLVRQGAVIHRHDSYEQLDRDRLRTLIATAFQAELDDAFFERKVRSIYVAADYRGVAILEDKPLAPYLSKFAVDIRARGEGIGGDLWRAMTSENRRLFWRSRSANPITSWYEENCDGLVRLGDWTVYWIGLATDEIGQAIELARAAPVDLA